jgi:hypothetical protein
MTLTRKDGEDVVREVFQLALRDYRSVQKITGPIMLGAMHEVTGQRTIRLRARAGRRFHGRPCPVYAGKNRARLAERKSCMTNFETTIHALTPPGWLLGCLSIVTMVMTIRQPSRGGNIVDLMGCLPRLCRCLVWLSETR